MINIEMLKIRLLKQKASATKKGHAMQINYRSTALLKYITVYTDKFQWWQFKNKTFNSFLRETYTYWVWSTRAPLTYRRKSDITFGFCMIEIIINYLNKWIRLLALKDNLKNTYLKKYETWLVWQFFASFVHNFKFKQTCLQLSVNVFLLTM